MIEVGKRLKEIGIELYSSVSTFAHELGMSQPNLSQYTSGKLAPGPVMMQKLANLGINLNWLMTGLGEKFISVTDHTFIKNNPEVLNSLFLDNENGKSISLVAGSQQKAYSKLKDSMGETLIYDTLKLPFIGLGEFRAFEVTDPLMNPCLKVHDIVVAEKIPFNGELAVDRIFVFVGPKLGVKIRRTLSVSSVSQQIVFTCDTCTEICPMAGKSIPFSELTECWEVKFKVTTDFPAPTKEFLAIRKLNSRINELEGHLNNGKESARQDLEPGNC